MTALIFFVLSLVAFEKAENTSNSTAKSPSTTYQLVWSDEFNTAGLPDSTKWDHEIGFVRNYEDQWYQKENAICENGLLVITGKQEHKPNPNYIPGSNNWRNSRQWIEYTASSLMMKKVHSYKYGKLEVRAKIDAQTGLWPAIWTLGVSGEWPSNGEVDVMEYYDNKILANYAWGSTKKGKAIWDGASIPVDSLGGVKWANHFHIWTYEWDEKTMIIALDGVVMNTADLTQTINQSDGKNPFHQPHYLLLNLAMGGTQGGSLSNTVLPSKYLIDYVRIYQKI
jgi:beta-glucanase (GH16 family)